MVASTEALRSPLVSVVIPTRDRPAMLGRAVESALRQTWRDLEVVIVDDASRDGRAVLNGAHAFGDPRVRVARLPHRTGGAGARNTGIHLARGEWIAFLDDDDEWLPRKLERQLERLDEVSDPSVTVVYCRGRRIPPGKREHKYPLKPLPEGDCLDDLLANKAPYSTSLYVARRDALLAAGGFDEAMPSAQDHDLWVRMAAGGNRFAAVDERLVTVHKGHEEHRISDDPTATLRGFLMLEARLRPLAVERLGRKAHRRWVKKRWRWLDRNHRRHLGRVALAGDRLAALRYARDLVRFLPWGIRHATGALSIAVLGGRASLALGVVERPDTPSLSEHAPPAPAGPQDARKGASG